MEGATMICEQSGCGCALTVASGTVTGSGTPADPWVLNVANSPSITQLQIDVANIFAALDALPGTYVDVAGDTMTGSLTINNDGSALRMIRPVNDRPFIEFWDGTNTTIFGYIVGGAFGMEIRSSVGEVKIEPFATERARFFSNGLLVGKTATNIGVAGVELLTTGQILTTHANVTFINQMNKIGAGVISGAPYISFQLSGSQIGSITRNAATSAILYNTTSDERMKNVIGDLDPELCEYILGIVTPMMFSWKDDEGNTPIAGYIAQQVARAWPQSIELGFVSPGIGDVTDRTFDSEGNETTPEGKWRPWMIDKTVIIPILHASLVRTTTKLSYLRAEFDEFKASVEDRLASLEDA
jgi:hypothetical protein